MGNGTPQCLMEMGRGGAYVPARVALQAIYIILCDYFILLAVPVCPPVSPCKGASIVQIPTHNACIFGMETPLRGRSGGYIGTAPTFSFGWIGRGWFCLLVGENGAHEPTPSVLYFLKSISMWGNHSPRVIMMCGEKKYNPQGGSLLTCIITQGRLRYTCQPCAIESITPMG